jgi:prepilin signal peptidase PulO-like enzyme (type II secretory pathway)
MCVYTNLVETRQKEGWKRSMEQWQNKKFRVFFILTLAAGIGLAAEGIVFSYSIWKICRYLILVMALFQIAWIDQRSKRIPNKILKILLAVRVMILLPEWLAVPELGMAILISSVFGALIGGGIFLLAHFISKGGVGMGDVKLFAVIGFYVGNGSIMAAAFLSVMAGAVYSITMLLFKKIKLKEEIPFAPFIFVGTILTMALGM